MSFLIFPGSNSPIADKDGMVTNTWRLFLNTIWNRVGGPNPDNSYATVAEAQGYANTAQSNAETAAQGYANTAQSNAETYAASEAATAQSNAETFATGAANTAQSNAETFSTDALDSALTTLQSQNVTLTTTAGSLTVAAAQLVKGVFIDSAVQTAAFTLTTDTATNLLAAMSNAAVNSGFVFRFLNNGSAAYAGTLAPGTGVTLSSVPANPAVPSGGWADYLFVCTAIGSTPAFTVYPIGGGSPL